MMDKFLMQHKRHMMFKTLRYWSDLMEDYAKRGNINLVNYYEGMISGSVDTMHSLGAITLQTLFNLNHLLEEKREYIRKYYY